MVLTVTIGACQKWPARMVTVKIQDGSFIILIWLSRSRQIINSYWSIRSWLSWSIVESYLLDSHIRIKKDPFRIQNFCESCPSFESVDLNLLKGCAGKHHHITPHFWDANVGTLGVQLMPSWPIELADDYPELSGPIPCIDWCDNGKTPEYRGPCTTQPPTTTTTKRLTTTKQTTTVKTTTTAKTTTPPKNCSDLCYDDFYECIAGCGNSTCQSACSRVHFDCIQNCSANWNFQFWKCFALINIPN